ncbi:MAG: hypothetical protein NC191_02675 [Muribaculaceae bacterium]|nr:hypothetical protein [Muribaculaceae bacterium]
MKLENDIKIRQIKPQYAKNEISKPAKQSTSFTGVSPTAVLNFFDTNQAWGACAVDLGFMVLPRTVTDFGRGANAGFETMRREGLGTANHSSVGLYGAGAGLALATALNGAYGLTKNDIKASSIFADAETVDLQGKIFTEASKEANPIETHLRRTLGQYHVEAPNGRTLSFSPEAIDKAVEILQNEINSDSKKINKKAAENVQNILASSVEGISDKFKIKVPQGSPEIPSTYSIDYIVDNAYKLPKIFTRPKVKETFEKTSNYLENAFLKSLKSMNKNRSLIGVGVASAVGVSAQPLNMYLTKLKTGESGFVGGGEEDKSAKFKAKKGLVAALFGAGVLSTIENPLKLIKNPKLLIKAIQYKDYSPTLKQFKFIYGITIMSRFLSSRNDNELKECTIKDTLGFANWLILGNFVQKLVAQRLDKSLIRNNGKGILNWLQNSTLKTRSEVLHSALGAKAFRNNGKEALTIREMIKELPKNHAARKQLKFLTIAQLAGYAYSGIVLGVGIPKLNIFLTKRRMAKQEAAKAQNEAKNPAQISTFAAAKKDLSNFTGYKMIHG